MCLYFGAMDYLIDIVAYCVCRVIEISFVAFVMVFGSKTKFLSKACSGINGTNICRCGTMANT
ncbi:uncharacterized protein LOC118732828 [Rhagoletis pomonella]|uniref:uncharacterized protein LOC118732828 n=1 Tax=Rhagoletis pomonella TaxID=28610 RepID=UPI00177D5CD2|nr:uncharacterized protein LOC118732828 [Rhagoletis pomonella]